MRGQGYTFNKIRFQRSDGPAQNQPVSLVLHRNMFFPIVPRFVSAREPVQTQMPYEHDYW